ncbi:MAG: 3-mercaptopyruvate sulfurtransferase [Fimbriimonadaceae bacterium]|nr:3-mercaptopyruvate sulfurtransferase [Alphaproteobacteria bacterium]
MRNNCLVSTEWLDQHLDAPDLVVVDASWHMPADQRDAYREFLEGHIRGAVFFDIDDISDSETDLPHMLPSNVKFSSRMRRMGIGDGKRIVVYDTRGIFSAARGWWTFRAMGVEEVAVLDGGLPKWLNEDRAIETGSPAVQERHFTARRNSSVIRDAQDIHNIVLDAQTQMQILDARSEGRFQGKEPEPRAGLRSGHIPNSINLPFAHLMNSDGTMKNSDDLKSVFEKAGVDLSRPVVTTCGSGVTAAILSLGLELAGHRNAALYDGSWSEWGGREDLPVDTA